MTVPKEKLGKVIKKIKVNKKAIVIVFSDGQRIDISEEAYTSNYLYIGKELKQSEINKLNRITSVKKLTEYALSLLSKKHYTEWAMREKLYAKEGSKEDIDYIIKKLKELDLINDNEYIEDYLGYAEEKNIGKNKIKQELLKRGVFQEQIDKIRFNSNLEKKKAIALIPMLEKKYERYSYQQKKQHIYQALISRGFDIETAKEALNHVSKIDEKSEKNKLKVDYKKCLERYRKKYSGRELKEKIMRYLISKGYKYNEINQLIGGMDNDF